MVDVAETITVYNKSGKAVSTSKHLVNVFKEAQSAYREKKAELKVQREGAAEQKRLLKDGKASSKSITSSRPAQARRSSSVRSDRDPHRHEHSRHHERRRHSGSRSPKHPRVATVTDDDQDDFQPRQIRRANTMAPPVRSPTLDGHRRHSDPDQLALAVVQNPSQASLHDPNLDMDLAYGELPPPLPVRPTNPEGELKTKMTALTRMLEEADCLRFSAAAMIKSLEKNPEQMAAVALTLAEISNLVSKMGPGTLKSLRLSFPAVVALLASPEFAIAIGVGVGLTVVALGGYKIIKRIQTRKADANRTDELEELGSADLDAAAPLGHVEAWRRGIEMDAYDDDDVRSVGTSVEGEFVTPGASARLEEEGLLAPKAEREREKVEKKERKKRSKETKTDGGSGSSRAGSDDGRTPKKELSGLRLLFKKDK